MLGPSPRMPHLCEKALHSGFKLNDALKAEWDQRLRRQKLLVSCGAVFPCEIIRQRSDQLT
jgi:hypothetical protein